MSQQEPKQIALSRTALFASLALIAGGAIIFLTLSGKQPTPTITQITPALKTEPTPTKAKPVTPAPKTIASKPKQTLPKPATPTKKTVVHKPEQTLAKTTKRKNKFVIEGLLSSGGEPWSANMIIIKILWLKNKGNQQFMLGQETSVVQTTPNGFAYRITLKSQAHKYLNWNAGVEGNVGRVIAFLDHKRDGRLTMGKDQIIAVSKELIRYRTGQFDKNILNEIQQQNIQQAGKGYVIVQNMQVDDSQTEWKVVANKSPARLDLNAVETSLPNMYNTFMKLQ